MKQTQIIVVFNQKGGCGKTTLSLQCAGTLARRGYKVFVADGDEQQSVVEVMSMSPEGAPCPINVCGIYKYGKKAHQELKKFVGIYDYIIVDCPPSADSPLAESALLVADLAIIPTLLGVQDVKAAKKVRSTLERVSTINPDLISRIVLNKKEETSLGKLVTDSLSDFGIPTMHTEIKKRVAYAESFLYGDSVHVLKSKAKDAIHEIEVFTDEIIALLNREPEMLESSEKEADCV